MVDRQVSSRSLHALDVAEIKGESVSAVASALIVGGGVGWWIVVMWFDFRLLPFAAFFSLFLAGFLAHAVYARQPKAARALLLLGPVLSLALALRSIGSPAVAYFAVVVVVANAAMSPLLALAAATMSSLTLLASLAPGPLLYSSLALLWVVAGVEWASSRGLHTAIGWAWASQERAAGLLERLRDRQGELNRTLVALVEANRRLERGSYELAIARQEAEEAREIKAQFAANVSHELRTPLNLIIGYSELMTRSPEVYGAMSWTPALRADLREIHSASQHLLGMIDDILDLSRVDAQHLPLRLEGTDLCALIAEAANAVRPLLRGKDVRLEVSLPPQLPELLLDRARIRQVLLNLLNNAARFTDHGRIEVCAEMEDDEVVVSVADTGVGIPSEDMEHIFEEFHQARGPIASWRGGTGLGLAICRRFVRLHGGEIEVDSQVGQGSVFRFRLPLPHSARTRHDLAYYAPVGWSRGPRENPLGKTAIVLGSSLEMGAPPPYSLPGYRTVPVAGLSELSERVVAEHPAGIVLLEDALDASALESDQVWRAAGRSDLPIIRCLVPDRRTVPEQLGVTEYLEKPVARDTLMAAIARACPTPQRVLVIDDDPRFGAFIHRLLKAAFATCHVRRAHSGRAGLAALAEGKYNLVLLDLTMPDMDGFQVIEAIHGRSSLGRVPIIVITGTGYGDQVVRRQPVRVELGRSGCSAAEMGRYITALLEVAPPDYSRPAPGGALPASAAAIPAF